MTEHPNSWYEQRLNEAQQSLQRNKRNITQVSYIRLLDFLLAAASIYQAFSTASWWWIGSSFVFLTIFIRLIFLHNRLYQIKERLENEILFCQTELKSLVLDLTDFDEGKEFMDSEHPYANDLDLFGSHSLFQLLNRTVTSLGRQQLVQMMKEHATQKDVIEDLKQATIELQQNMETLLHFRVTGMSIDDSGRLAENIKEWAKRPTRFRFRLATSIVVGVMLFNLLTLAGALLDLFPFTVFINGFVIFVVLSVAFIKKATKVQDEFGKQFRYLKLYARLINEVQQQKWESKLLKHINERLTFEGKNSELILNQLAKELDRLDLRNNQIMYVLLEGSCFFQLLQMIRINRWKQHYGSQLPEWLDALGEFDALCSMGIFRFNHPLYCEPQPMDGPFTLIADDMGHPLMYESSCVKNPITIPRQPYFLIITGANMAGKSTYLRTVGINYLLACMGLPVCAKEFRFTPHHLYTSLRTSDSLSKNESYFFAELKRLRHIISRLEANEKLFIILDEILKGTNSVDKQQGSIGLIKQFIHMQTNGIIATHDLVLGNMIQEFPNYVANYCFEAEIKQDELRFDYKMKQGITQNMNASFLMKKMGITRD